MTSTVVANRWRVGVLAFAVLGLALRVLAYRGRLGTLDSDEAVVGLLADDLAHGRWSAFYWGQHYGGTLEPGLSAVVVALFGTSVIAVKGVPLVLSAVAAVLVWRVGRRIVEERVAQAAALLCWVAPAGYLWWSIKGRGFYWVSMCLGLGILLAAVHAAARPNRWWPWCAIGLLTGLAFWTSPTVVYFAAPAAVWLLAHRRVDWIRVWVTVPTFALGALPWLWHNVGNGWPSLDRTPQPERVSYLEGGRRFLWGVLPMALDLRVPHLETWIVPVLAPIAFFAILAGIAAAFVRRDERPTLVLLGLLAYPVLYGIFPVAWFVGEGRYGLFALPFLALAIAWAVRRPPLLLATCVVASSLTVYGLARQPAEGPRRVDGVVAALRAAGVDHLWVDYWLANRLTYASDRRLIASSAVAPRHQQFVHEILADRTPAYAYGSDDDRAAELAALLRERAVPFHVIRLRGLTVLQLGAPVYPEQLPAELRV